MGTEQEIMLASYLEVEHIAFLLVYLTTLISRTRSGVPSVHGFALDSPQFIIALGAQFVQLRIYRRLCDEGKYKKESSK
jgi:hypothetical protein